MAATRRELGALRALTAAALALPGLVPAFARGAEDDEFSVQYGRYREGERKLYGANSRFDPIEADSLRARGRATLADRFELAFDFVQDTWSGATPITTAPLLLGGNRASAPDGVSGATPFIQGDLYLDGLFQPVRLDAAGQVAETRTQLVHTLSSASPETRSEGDLSLGYEWDEAMLGFGAGLSREDDYEARTARVGGRWDLDRKRTSLSFDARYTAGQVDATLDHDAVPYIDTSAYPHDVHVHPATGDRLLRDDRDEWGVELGLERVLGRNSVLETRVGYSRAAGYLENPYKVMEVAFLDPEQQFLAPPGGYFAQVRALLERRPGERGSFTWDTRYVRYLERLRAALHLEYRLFHDDWGIDAHAVEASWVQPVGGGWTLTPLVRFYSQTSAHFYAPYLVTPQAYVTVVSDPITGDIISMTPFDPALLPADYSSDQRLSSFGALGVGLTVEKPLGKGASLRASFEYYRHEGGLALGGGGEDSYADFDYWQGSLSLRLDASALRAFGYRSGVARGHASHGSAPPAGVWFAHMLDAGDVMVGYHSLWSRQRGSMLYGASSAPDAQILAAGCEGGLCRTVPDRMDMHMQMLELGWAPSARVSLMAMPALVDMRMEMRPLAGAAPDVHASHDHETGGVGDLPLVALLRLYDGEQQHVHAGFGVSVPLGAVNIDLRRTHQEDRGRIDYGMQLGSGTWDLLPSLTYTGAWQRWSWGGQLGATKRLGENESGYALGDVVQATTWGALRVTHWLSGSLRVAYTHQGSIDGRYDTLHDDSGPMDFPENYGGEYWDAGFGASVVVPSGYLEGNQFALEWLEPLYDDVHGFQLERRGSLVASWSVAF